MHPENLASTSARVACLRGWEAASAPFSILYVYKLDCAPDAVQHRTAS